MEHVEADERRLLDAAPADQELARRRSDVGHRGGDVGADRHGPVGELVPRQQVSGEGEEERQEEHRDADDPVPLALLVLTGAVLVRAGQEDADEVQEHDRDHEVRRDPVHRADPRAEGDDVLDVLDGGVGPFDRRDVEKEQRQPGEHEEEQQGRRRGAEPERVVPGERRLVALRGEPVQQEVRDDGVARFAVRGRAKAPPAPRMHAGRGGGLFLCAQAHAISFTRASGESRGRPGGRGRRRAARPPGRRTGGTRPGAWERGPRRWSRRRCISSRGRGRGSGA